jgi:hypothetical protein
MISKVKAVFQLKVANQLVKANDPKYFCFAVYFQSSYL